MSKRVVACPLLSKILQHVFIFHLLHFLKWEKNKSILKYDKRKWKAFLSHRRQAGCPELQLVNSSQSRCWSSAWQPKRLYYIRPESGLVCQQQIQASLACKRLIEKYRLVIYSWGVSASALLTFGGWITVVCGGGIVWRLAASLVSTLQMPGSHSFPSCDD